MSKLKTKTVKTKRTARPYAGLEHGVFVLYSVAPEGVDAVRDFAARDRMDDCLYLDNSGVWLFMAPSFTSVDWTLNVLMSDSVSGYLTEIDSHLPPAENYSDWNKIHG